MPKLYKKTPHGSDTANWKTFGKEEWTHWMIHQLRERERDWERRGINHNMLLGHSMAADELELFLARFKKDM